MATVLLLRHAETEWNAQQRLQGRLESPLTAAGVRQAAAAATTLPGEFGLVVTSDLQRARRTAQPYVDRQGVELRLDERLRERSWGEWEGLSHDEVEAMYPGWRGNGVRAPGYETDDIVWSRVAPVVDELATIDRPVLCVTHGGVIGVIARRFGSDARRMGNLEGLWIEVTPTGAAIGDRERFVEDV